MTIGKNNNVNMGKGRLRLQKDKNVVTIQIQVSAPMYGALKVVSRARDLSLKQYFSDIIFAEAERDSALKSVYCSIKSEYDMLGTPDGEAEAGGSKTFILAE